MHASVPIGFFSLGLFCQFWPNWESPSTKLVPAAEIWLTKQEKASFLHTFKKSVEPIFSRSGASYVT